MRPNKNLKRVIVDYNKLNDNILNLLVTNYPYGYDEDNIITFKNQQNEVVECVEVRTEDTAYLVKVSKRLVAAMEEYDNEGNNHNHEDDDLDLDSNKDRQSLPRIKC